MQTTLTPAESEMFKALVVDYHTAWSPGHEPFNISNAERYYSKDDELTAYDVMHTDGMIKGWENYIDCFIQHQKYAIKCCKWIDYNLC